MSRTAFGLGVPNINAELLAMAVLTIIQWNIVAYFENQALGDLLFNPEQPPTIRHIIPGQSKTSLVRFRVGATAWSAGCRG